MASETTYFPATSQKVAISGTSAASSAIGSYVNKVRLHSTTDCFVEFGSAPTAVANTSMFIGANLPEYFDIRPGHKVAVIQSSASGNLYITEMTK